MNNLHPAVPAPASSYMASGDKLLVIDGKQVPSASGETFEVIDPTTEAVLCRVASANAEDVDRAVVAAQRAFEDKSWAGISPAERARYLLKVADLIEQHADELGAIQSLEMGMVFKQTRAMAIGQADLWRYYAGWITKIGGRTSASNDAMFNYTVREPLGVVGAIIPWNGPILATSWKLAPALACGNTVVLKPAEVAPLAAMRIVELVHEAGLPPGVVNVVPGMGDRAGTPLVEHPLVAKIAFTGSTAVGRKIAGSAAAANKHIGMELGGKSPVLVFADADLDQAVAIAVMGFTANTGQACAAGTRLFVENSILDEFTKKLVAKARSIRAGSPFDDASDIGPLSSSAQRDRVAHYVDIGQSQGARLLTGGMRPGTGYFAEPTVFDQVEPDMTIVREEIFGPVAVLSGFADEADAIRQGNDTEYGLVGSIYTRDIGRVHRVARSLKAGMIRVNLASKMDADMPFGGYKSSGTGRELGPESLDEYSQVKSVMIDL